MAHKAEYKVISDGNPPKLDQEINAAAMQGFKPILMTTATATMTSTAGASQAVIVTTVILEHVLGT